VKSLTLRAATVLFALGLSGFASSPARTTESLADPAMTAGPRDGLAREVLEEINFLRTDPQGYVQVLRDYRTRFRENIVVRPGRVSIQTYEGVAAVDEAIRDMQRQPAVTALRPDAILARAAADHVADQGASGGFGHYGADGRDFTVRIARRGGQPYGGENISYGYETAREVVLQLLVDDNVRDRGHRVNLFREGFVRAGAACGRHARYDYMCVIDFGY